ncbi:BRO family protein [Pseudomonas pseudonitroreducens]|uniref:BRO family protein n=2 Tax=Pseudomonas pseudonitroreducens TaxID=2892326 RepID=UPI001F30447D|nr:BRO family protein [Pseudomonas pseudonitroreducens]
MDDSSLPTPLPFPHHRRTLRALLIDDQVWFLLSDFCRVTGYTHEDRMAMRMADDQIRQERLLTEDGLELDQVLISESAVYQALVLFNVPDYGSLRRWISGTVVPQVRSQFKASGPRHVQLQFERQCLRVLEWQDNLWVSFSDLPRVLGGRSPIAGRTGWRGWAKRLRM